MSLPGVTPLCDRPADARDFPSNANLAYGGRRKVAERREVSERLALPNRGTLCSRTKATFKG